MFFCNLWLHHSDHRGTNSTTLHRKRCIDLCFLDAVSRAFFILLKYTASSEWLSVEKDAYCLQNNVVMAFTSRSYLLTSQTLTPLYIQDWISFSFVYNMRPYWNIHFEKHFCEALLEVIHHFCIVFLARINAIILKYTDVLWRNMNIIFFMSIYKLTPPPPSMA